MTIPAGVPQPIAPEVDELTVSESIPQYYYYARDRTMFDSGVEKEEDRRELVRIPTCAIFHKFASGKGVPHSFVGFIRQWPALPQVVVSLQSETQTLRSSLLMSSERYSCLFVYFRLPEFPRMNDTTSTKFDQSKVRSQKSYSSCTYAETPWCV